MIEEEPFEDDARVRLYRLRREPFLALHEWLGQVESFWTEQLGSFKAAVEQRARGKR